MKSDTSSVAAVAPAAFVDAHVMKRARKSKNGAAALREIKKLQSTDKHVIPRESLRRLIAETVQSIDPELCVAVDAVEALRTAAESTLAQVFSLAGALSNELSKKSTVEPAAFRAAVNLLTSDHLFSTAGVTPGALTAPLV
jgi:histone H3/H4